MNKYKKNSEINSYFYSSKNVILREIKGKNKNILDVGCNEGYFGKNDSEISNKYYGIDIMDEAIKVAKNHYEEARVYNLEKLETLGFDVNKFDYIIFGDVLEHIKNPIETLKFFSENYLNTNGKLIISLPNIANWQVRIKLLFGYFDYTETGILDDTHLKLYTYKSAKKLAEESGLKIDKILFGANIFGPILRFIPFLKGLLSTNIILVCSK